MLKDSATGLQREAVLGEYNSLSIMHCSVEGQMQRECQKLQRQSATTDCNGKVLPLEAATGRWIRWEKRGDRENDGELEMGKFELAA